MKMAKTFLAAAAIILGAASLQAAKPEVIAHRGYWTPEGSAQNSIRSLVKADSIGCYASEFDIWMTLDSVIVLNHDPSINGIVIEESPSEVVLAQKLSNGENVPTLDEFLNVAKDLKIRLVCELKPHNSNSGERAAIKRTLDLVKKYGLEDRTEYITFSKAGFVNLVNAVPEGTGVQYLTGDYIPAQVKFMKGKGIDYSLKAMRKHPEWIKKCHNLGLTVNVWTVNKPEDMQWCIDNGVDYITTNDPELLQSMLK